MTNLRDLVQPSEWSRPFWTGGANDELLIYRCQQCRRWFHPPAPACCHCQSRQVAPEPASGYGTVQTFTVNHHPWSNTFPPPYVISIVALAEDPGTRVTTNIVNCNPDAVFVGMPVHVLFRPAGDIYLPLFEPV